MACCKSMIARRIVLWYILLGSFVICPLSLIVGFGCRFLNVGFENQDEVESFGAFSVAIYDAQERGSNNFLGCVRPSTYWQEETSYDIGFTTLKISSAFMLAFTIVATFICVCVQCFSKHGKSHLWGIMRICYIGAAASQGVMYTVFISELCQTDEVEDDDTTFAGFLAFNLGDKKCSPGHTGILGVVNFALLFGMVIATFNSLPPRNPVFQCWGGDVDWDDDSENSGGETSEEDSEMKNIKSMVVENDDSVSLFSRKSRKSIRSASTKSDDAASDAEKGIATKSIGSRSRKSSIPSAYEKYKVVEETADEVSVEVSVKSPVKETVKAEAEEVAVETVESPSVKSEVSKKKFPGVTKFFKRKDKPAKEKETIDVPKVTPSDESILGPTGLNTLSSVVSSTSGTTLEVTNFVIQLIEMTELKDGGRRVKIADVDNQVEIVDEYPKVPGGEIETSDSDVAQVRTEFYDLGSRTIKTITHKDGSKTIVTTIVVEHGNESITASITQPPEYPLPLEPPQEMTHSNASIDSISSSKYKVVGPGASSVTTYKGVGNNKEILRQGDLALSVGTTSVKSGGASAKK